MNAADKNGRVEEHDRRVVRPGRDHRRGSLRRGEARQARVHRGEGGGEGDRQDEVGPEHQDTDVAGGQANEAGPASQRCQTL